MVGLVKQRSGLYSRHYILEYFASSILILNATVTACVLFGPYGEKRFYGREPDFLIYAAFFLTIFMIPFEYFAAKTTRAYTKRVAAEKTFKSGFYPEIFFIEAFKKVGTRLKISH